MLSSTDTQREANPAKDHIVESFLRPATKVSISLLDGKTAQESSNRSKEDFKKELKRFITGNAIDGADRIAAALLWDMTNQVVLGNEEARIWYKNCDRYLNLGISLIFIIFS